MYFFILHYKDVYDMLEKIETELVDDFNTMLDSCIETSPDPDPHPLCVHSFLMQTNIRKRYLRF